MTIADQDPIPPTITRDDILGSDRWLRLWLDRLSSISARSATFLALVILLPLAGLAVSAWIEGRFFPGSLNCSALPSHRLIPGMSFLGDTMVWPFVFLVPLTFLLLSVTINRFELLFRHPERFLSPRWLQEHPDRYREIIEQTRAVFQAAGPWRGLRRVAIASGAAFFLYNLVTCTFPLRFHPYQATIHDLSPIAAARSTIRICPRVLIDQTQFPLRAGDRVPILKWDTDPLGGPKSWAAARVWVLLFGYTWVPLLLYKVANLVGGLYFFIHQVTIERALEIQPLSPDRAGGLSMFSTTAYSCIYPLIAIALMFGMTLIKETASAAGHDLALLVVFVPLFIAAFFVPLLSVHGAMQECRERSLADFSLLFNDLDRRLRTVLRAPTIDLDELKGLEAARSCVRESFERSEQMPVWPFQLQRVVTLLGSAAVAGVPKLATYLIHRFTGLRIDL